MSQAPQTRVLRTTMAENPPANAIPRPFAPPNTFLGKATVGWKFGLLQPNLARYDKDFMRRQRSRTAWANFRPSTLPGISSRFKSFWVGQALILRGESSHPCPVLSVVLTTDSTHVFVKLARAIKYAYPGGGGAIEVAARVIEGHLQIEVSDQGIDLPDGFAIDQPRASLGFK